MHGNANASRGTPQEQYAACRQAARNAVQRGGDPEAQNRVERVLQKLETLERLRAAEAEVERRERVQNLAQMVQDDSLAPRAGLSVIARRNSTAYGANYRVGDHGSIYRVNYGNRMFIRWDNGTTSHFDWDYMRPWRDEYFITRD